MLILKNKILVISFFLIGLYFFLVFWILFHKKTILPYPKKPCSIFYTYKGLYDIDTKHLSKAQIFTTAENHSIDFLLVRQNQKNTKSFYHNKILIAPLSDLFLKNTTKIVALNKIWSDKFRYNKLHIFWTLLIYPFAPQTAFLYLLQHSNSVSKEKTFLKTKLNTVASFNIRHNNFFNYYQVPTYNQLFSLVKNYIFVESDLTGRPQQDTNVIYKAITKAQSFVGFDFLGDTKNFCSYAKIQNDLNTQIKPIGSKIKLSDNKKISIYIRLPSKPQFSYRVKIYRNHKLFLTYSAIERYIKINKPGVYKILVELLPETPKPFKIHWTPWIISNTFFIQAGAQ